MEHLSGSGDKRGESGFISGQSLDAIKKTEDKYVYPRFTNSKLLAWLRKVRVSVRSATPGMASADNATGATADGIDRVSEVFSHMGMHEI